MKWGMVASAAQELLLYADLPQHPRREVLEAQLAAAAQWVPAEPAWLGGCDDPDDGPLWAEALAGLTADSPMMETLVQSAAQQARKVQAEACKDSKARFEKWGQEATAAGASKAHKWVARKL